MNVLDVRPTSIDLPTENCIERAIFISGSDTEIGKTWAGCAIVRGLRFKYSKVGVYKPVASGIFDSRESDGYRLWEASGLSLERLSHVTSFAFREAVAPIVAAEQIGSTIDLGVLDEGLEYWRKSSDFVVVEGAGGLLSPVTETMNNADLAARWHLPLALVIPDRLGCVNQAMLTLEVARARQLNTICVILNRLPTQADDPSHTTNFELLRSTMNRSGFETVQLFRL